MKHLKTYESEINNDFKFNIGDKIICIDNSWPNEALENGKEYIVLDRKKYGNFNYYGISDTNGYKLKSLLSNSNELAFYGEKIFVTPIEYNINKYNI